MYPEDLKYTQTHEWLRRDGDIITTGITEHAQDKLGEVVFIELPDSSAKINASDDVCVVESVKAAADVYAPISGTIEEVNEVLIDAPSLVNSDPYGDGWLYKIKLSDEQEYEELLNSNDYQEFISENDVEE